MLNILLLEKKKVKCNVNIQMEEKMYLSENAYAGWFQFDMWKWHLINKAPFVSLYFDFSIK